MQKSENKRKEGRKKSHKYFGSETYVKFHTSLLYIKFWRVTLAHCEHAQVFVLLFAPLPPSFLTPQFIFYIYY
jgi:hypothetical protein